MSEYNKILIIGLDGGTWEVLDLLMEGGEMPSLARLVEEGTSGVLNSTLPPLTPPAWASFQTGVYPAKHGIYDFTQYRLGSYKPDFVSSASLAKKTIWKILSEAGKKVFLVGVPLTYPPKQVNGIVISGLLTPNLRSNFTYPAEFKTELLDAIGTYRFIASQDTFFSRGLDVFLTDVVYSERKRVEATEYILKKYQWDIGMIQFQSVDNLQHALWPLLDPASKECSPEKWQKVSSFFQFIDDSIGKLLTLVGENTNIIIMSDHGFGPLVKTVYLNKWLESKGLLKVKNSVRTKSTLQATNLLKKIDFLKLRRLLLSQEKRENLLSSITQEIAIDWSQTKCYMLSGSQAGNIYINLKGREPQGVVTSEEYEEVGKGLKAELESFRDVNTGQPIVKKVYYREDISSDSFEFAPDLLIEPRDGYMFTRGLGSSSIFEIPQFGRDEVGCHRKEGIYVLNGPDFKALGKGPEADIVDVPATILTLMGIEPPVYFDGNPMGFALNHGVVQKRSQGGEETKLKNQGEEVYSEEDKQIMGKRLKDLGYL